MRSVSPWLSCPPVPGSKRIASPRMIDWMYGIHLSCTMIMEAIQDQDNFQEPQLLELQRKLNCIFYKYRQEFKRYDIKEYHRFTEWHPERHRCLCHSTLRHHLDPLYQELMLIRRKARIQDATAWYQAYEKLVSQQQL